MPARRSFVTPFERTPHGTSSCRTRRLMSADRAVDLKRQMPITSMPNGFRDRFENGLIGDFV